MEGREEKKRREREIEREQPEKGFLLALSGTVRCKKMIID